MKSIIALILLLLSPNIFSQQLAVTIDGDTLEIYENGTWKNYNPKSEKIVSIKTDVEATVKVDEFTGKKSISTEQWSRFASGTLSGMSGSAYQNETGIVYFSITFHGDLGCMVKQESNMMVKLSNGHVVPLIYISDTDCGSYSLGTWIALSKDDLKDPNFKDIIKENNELLKNYDWTKIRVSGSEVYADLEPKKSRKTQNPEQFFRQHILSIKSQE